MASNNNQIEQRQQNKNQCKNRLYDCVYKSALYICSHIYHSSNRQRVNGNASNQNNNFSNRRHSAPEGNMNQIVAQHPRGAEFERSQSSDKKIAQCYGQPTSQI